MKILILLSREGALRLIKGIELQKRTDIDLNSGSFSCRSREDLSLLNNRRFTPLQQKLQNAIITNAADKTCMA